MWAILLTPQYVQLVAMGCDVLSPVNATFTYGKAGFRLYLVFHFCPVDILGAMSQPSNQNWWLIHIGHCHLIQNHRRVQTDTAVYQG